MRINELFYFATLFLFSYCLSAQEISLYQQFNGRYDFVFAGNTMNIAENGANDPCLILTSSSAALALSATDNITSAYLYWAGSGPGDFNVRLNNTDVTASRTFGLTLATTGLPFFSAFADVTTQVQTEGIGTYTLSNLDLAPFLNPGEYCNNGTNFGGWALVVIYQNDALPLNQLNVYDGLKNVPGEINITLSSLNVIDNQDAKIGFVAWEGDASIQLNETLRINGTPLGNPPLNPVNNAFNGTNSFTGASNLYNMDLDVYNIQNNIAIGDTTAQIQLTSGQDFVMVNAIVTKLNSQLPDATIAVNNIDLECNSRTVIVDFTVSNLNSTNDLPVNVPIRIYVDGTFVDDAQTLSVIAIDGSESQQITLTIPDGIPNDFTLLFVVDDNGTGGGNVAELIETNNTFSIIVTLLTSPLFNTLPPLLACNRGFGSAIFDFSGYTELVRLDPTHIVTFHESALDAQNGVYEISNTSNYFAQTTPKEIFVRIEDSDCNSITSFMLLTRNCPPTVYNYVSANEDGTNDDFFVDGLRDIFVNFKIEIYNRWGTLIWDGNNNTENWRGNSTKGIRTNANQVPDGTYYYLIFLNDPDYRDPLTGFLYLNR